jgi:hypothetical protein
MRGREALETVKGWRIFGGSRADEPSASTAE